MQSLLQLSQLGVHFQKQDGSLIPGVTDVHLDIMPGETLGLVGESGSGKTITALAVMGLLPRSASIASGNIHFQGQELSSLNPRKRRAEIGGRISMIFQDPFLCFSPYYTVGSQMADGIRHHLAMTNRRALECSAEWLERVGIPNPQRVLKEYPSQLSGGMLQRVMIAMALSTEPSLLIADEPTTALDVTRQAEILELLAQFQNQNEMSVLFISHDLGVISQMCERTAVMYAGQIVEAGRTSDLFGAPNHPYTGALINATPRITQTANRFQPIPGQVPAATQWGTGCRFADRCSHVSAECQRMPELGMVFGNRTVRCWHWNEGPFISELSQQAPMLIEVHSAAESGDSRVVKEQIQPDIPLLQVNGLKTYYPIKTASGKTGQLRAVDNVSFELRHGETLALVGESGSGKSTLGRTIMRAIEPTEGDILFEGKAVREMTKKELIAYRQQVQIVFQSASSFMNPRVTIGQAISEPMEVHRLYDKHERADKVAELLQAVGLDHTFKDRYPHECSGGQKQRIGIARALALNPKLIIADEPVSALDVSIQAQILNLFQDLKEKYGLSYLFISHDLSVVRNLADRVAVMNLGKIVEMGDPAEMFEAPQHPYTRALLSSIPQLDVHDMTEKIVLTGETPSPTEPLAGCVFTSRCPFVMERCRHESPVPSGSSSGNWAACHLLEQGVTA